MTFGGLSFLVFFFAPAWCASWLGLASRAPSFFFSRRVFGAVSNSLSLSVSLCFCTDKTCARPPVFSPKKRQWQTTHEKKRERETRRQPITAKEKHTNKRAARKGKKRKRTAACGSQPKKKGTKSPRIVPARWFECPLSRWAHPRPSAREEKDKKKDVEKNKAAARVTVGDGWPIDRKKNTRISLSTPLPCRVIHSWFFARSRSRRPALRWSLFSFFFVDKKIQKNKTRGDRKRKKRLGGDLWHALPVRAVQEQKARRASAGSLPPSSCLAEGVMQSPCVLDRG
ncbi:hypothetical protein psal_cds_265 [Pandoravirus salinus]|uniref:Uncharacterized protein n=1 Tax=Pandoravirus salinus TaxID=1349410 RepID=S4VWL7_9VIRU|nr:hypothetical protein psal_cds_265 [Pandoravirus salinus]AGO83836.1 hypothetical protein psal_cds_265 [Pandoravirus salinus]